MMRQGQFLRCLAALAALSSALPTACKKGRPSESPEAPPALGPVSVKPIPAVDVRGQAVHIDEGQLAAKVKSVLAQAGVFAEAQPKRATVAVALEAQPFAEGNAEALEMGVKLRLRMTIRPEGAALARFSEDVAAMGQAPLDTHDVGEAKAAFQRLAERTAEDLVQAYVARLKLWSGDAKAVATALGASDSDLRVEALRIVGARKLREQVPVVIRLLADEDEGVRDAALGTLVALRERGAVKALAESRPMRDTREMRKVLDAIATLGGSEAQDYLAFVAETHDDEEIRAMAKAALERLGRGGARGDQGDQRNSLRPTK
jgi:hypothetical protein